MKTLLYVDKEGSTSINEIFSSKKNYLILTQIIFLCVFRNKHNAYRWLNLVESRFLSFQFLSLLKTGVIVMNWLLEWLHQELKLYGYYMHVDCSRTFKSRKPGKTGLQKLLFHSKKSSGFLKLITVEGLV